MIYDVMNDCASTKPKATRYDLDDSIADTDDERDREDEFISAADQQKGCWKWSGITKLLSLWNLGS